MSSRDINGSTTLCLIIGDPVSHSLTPQLHNAGYKAADLNFCMAAAKVAEEELSRAIAGVRSLAIGGLAVTMPHKVSIRALLDELDPVAHSIGAVNTVLNKGGRLIGHNTDWLGILRPLQSRLNLAGKRIAILGAGGAAQAAIYACFQAGGIVTVFSRSADKAQQLATRYGAKAADLTSARTLRDFDIIINATPVGMGTLADRSPLTVEQLSCDQLILETIYAPRETKLIQFAREIGCKVITGDEMFLEQAAAQFEIHTSVVAPREAMATCLQQCWTC
ncbi:MAG: shikimate dehydrogenase [Pseudomonadota bacterium]|jgi:shikimate dehydrogenase